jgi:hypothetical protein
LPVPIKGVGKDTWSAGFLLAAPAALQLVMQLEQQLGISLRQARGMISAAEEGKYLSLQPVAIPTGDYSTWCLVGWHLRSDWA